MIKSETGYIKNHKSLIDFFFSINPFSFKKTHVTETRLSDCHKFISTLFKSRFSKATPKVKNLDQSYDLLTNSFLKDLNKYDHLKKLLGKMIPLL